MAEIRIEGIRRAFLGWVVGAFVALGFGLRMWGIDFGLPHEYCRPDETTTMYKALAIGAGDLNPHFFNYPSLHFYVVAAALGLCYAMGHALGYIADIAELRRLFFVDPSPFYLIGRTLTAAMGAGSVALAYSLGRKLDSERAGLVSAGFLAVAFLHVRDSHFLTVDVPATFYATAAFVYSFRYLARPRLQSAVLAGACLGLAASTKYNTALFAPAILLAVCLASNGGEHRQGASTWLAAARSAWRHVTVSALTMGVVFVAGSPFVVLDSSSFWRDLSFESAMFAAGRGEDLGWGWSYHLHTSLFHGLGWPLLMAALVGCVWLFLRRRPADLVLLSGIVAYYIVAGSGKSVFVRYAVPLVPLLCVVAGAALCRVTRTLSGRWLVAAALAIAAPTTIATWMHNRLLSRVDTRVLAAEWIEQHLPSGTRVALAGTAYGHPRLRTTDSWKRERLEDLQRAGEWRKKLEAEISLADQVPGPRYDILELQAANPQHLRSVWAEYSVERLDEAGVRWVLTQEHSLGFSNLDSGFRAELRRLGSLAYEIEPLADSGTEPSFDPIDAFYVPLAGFSAVERPGPTIRIFQLVRQPEDGKAIHDGHSNAG